MKKAIISLAASVLVLAASTAFSSEKGHWSYSGHSGPEHWGELDNKYEMCGKGRNQSPIDLTGFVEADLQNIDINYGTTATEILNNGHAIQVNYAKGSVIKVEGDEFELKQFHFHAPSENHINGKSFAMEAHLVHADKDGNLAVVAVMLEEGKSNPLIKTLWKSMPEKAGDKNSLGSGISVKGMLPASMDYYRFNGSLTTPPCTEGVRWYVLKQPVSVSKEDVEKFEHAMHHPNNRPIQPVNARALLQ